MNVLLQMVYYSALLSVPQYGTVGLCRRHFIDVFYTGYGILLILLLVIEIEKALRVFNADISMRLYTDFYDSSIKYCTHYFNSTVKGFHALIVGCIEQFTIMTDLALIVMFQDGVAIFDAYKSITVAFVVLNFVIKAFGLGLYVKAQVMDYYEVIDEESAQRDMYDAQLCMVQ